MDARTAVKQGFARTALDNMAEQTMQEEDKHEDLADEDLAMFAEMAEAQEVPTYAEDEIGRQLDEGLKNAEQQLTAIRGVKVSIKREVARAMDLSGAEFDRHFIAHATETGQRFKKAWAAYEEGYLAKLGAVKEKATRGQTSETVREYLETKGSNYFACRVDEETDKSKWDSITWEAYLMWRLKMILFEDKAGLLKINGFSETVAYQLCWMLRCNRVYSRNASLKAKQRRSRGSGGGPSGVAAPTTPDRTAARTRPPATPSKQDRRAKVQLTRTARGMFEGGARPEQPVRRERRTKRAERATEPAEQTTQPAEQTEPGKTSRADKRRERALGKLAEATAQADKVDAGVPAADGEDGAADGAESADGAEGAAGAKLCADGPGAAFGDINEVEIDEVEIDEEEMLIGEDAQPLISLTALQAACPLPTDAEPQAQRNCNCRYHGFARVKRLCVGRVSPNGVMSAAGGGEADTTRIDDEIVGGDTNAGPADESDRPLLALTRNSKESRDTAASQKWLDRMMSSEAVPVALLREAVAGLYIDPSSLRMWGSHVRLKWWQAVTVWEAVKRIRAKRDGGVVLGDKVGLGKTYEALAILLQVSGPDGAKLCADGL
jgi:hypothetical protein